MIRDGIKVVCVQSFVGQIAFIDGGRTALHESTIPHGATGTVKYEDGFIVIYIDKMVQSPFDSRIVPFTSIISSTEDFDLWTPITDHTLEEIAQINE